jgi:hypothetical protein
VSAAAWSQNQRPHKPEIQAFDIINDEQQKEKHAANQFFSSLLSVPSPSSTVHLPLDSIVFFYPIHSFTTHNHHSLRRKSMSTGTLVAGPLPKIGRRELEQIPVPEATLTHKPVPHHVIVEALVETLSFR